MSKERDYKCPIWAFCHECQICDNKEKYIVNDVIKKFNKWAEKENKKYKNKGKIK